MPDAVDPKQEEAARARRIEAGRLFFAKPWRFARSAPTIAALPSADEIEIAFAGRSNVGKSSLVNALTGQKGLARTSNTPGRTQEINFFTAEGSPLVLVDLPGYGYAQVSRDLVRSWTRLIFDYLRGRARLRRIYVLVDARHGLKENDRDALDALDKAAVSYQIVLTKTDKVKKDALGPLVAATEEAIAKRPAAHPKVLATSSETGFGIDELRAEIAAIAAGNAPHAG
jgi:GTP-binding protein